MRLGVGLSAAALCLAGWVSPASALTQDDFLVRNTADLVNLCSAPSTDPLYTAGANFCQGFIVGVVRVLDEVESAHQTRRLFCMSAHMPSRTQATADYVQWAKASPDRLAMQPTDSIGAFLSQKLPCPRG